MNEETDDFLAHFGVRGMRWGVRRRNGSEVAVLNDRKKLSKNVRKLSDDDLKKSIERLTNEKKLKTLVNDDLYPGRAFTKKIVNDTGSMVLKTAAGGVALYGIKKVVAKKHPAVAEAIKLK